jgi:RNA polymerase-binding transcription factor DksA
MRKDQLNRQRQALLALLDRVTLEVNHVVDSIHQEIDVAEHESFAPVHLADFTSIAADADVRLLETERHLREQVRAALRRLESGTYGKCLACGEAISAERLEALPYVSLCTPCADTRDATVGQEAQAGGMIRLTGFDAVEYAELAGLTLNKAADSIDDVVTGLTIAEAQAIADEDPDLIWLEVPADEYYGPPRNMEPGTTLTNSSRRRAGQRPDELAPGEDSGEQARDRSAIGTPGGGTAAGGLAGTNSAYAVPEGTELEDAMASGRSDHSGDRVSTDEPQSGRAGGAVGGTPAGKRTRGK